MSTIQDDILDRIRAQERGKVFTPKDFLDLGSRYDVPIDLPDHGRWRGLKRIGVAISLSDRGGKSTSDVRYYILSKKMSARSFAAASRGHGGIENPLHWQLDMTFGEDHCRTRKGRADATFSILRRTALSRLKNEHTAKVGMKNKRLMAAWNNSYLEKVLFGT